jgi:proteasome beta subunit
LRVAVEALIAAAEEDSATGGPDLRRGIFPNVVTVTAEGFAEIDDADLVGVAEAALENRP